jgi:putative ABC transport system ATP-binding protein
MPNNPSTPVVILKDISKIYHIGDQTLYALNRLSLTINRGEFVSVVGPSGSGKSTFLHIASLLDQPSDGEIFINNINTTKFTEVERAQIRNQEVGFIFQQFNLLPKTSSLENVALPLVYANISKSERQRRAQAMLEKVGLTDRLENTPAQLSGGQQQRVAIARALVNNPSVIFADEPTGNLDSKSGDEIKQIMLDLHQEGRTIIMVTHESKLANMSERIISLKDGSIISDQKP